MGNGCCCCTHKSETPVVPPPEKPASPILNKVCTSSSTEDPSSSSSPSSAQASRAPTPAEQTTEDDASDSPDEEPPPPRPRVGRYNKVGLSETDPLLLIEGYEDEPIVSLEEALKFLRGTVPDLDDQIRVAKAECPHPSKHNLTHDESAALYLYLTLEDGDTVHSRLQKAWETNDRAKLKPWWKYLKLLKSGFDKLPDAEDQMWQGMLYDESMGKLLQQESLLLYTCMGVAAPSKTDVKADLQSSTDSKMILVGYYSVGGKDVTDYRPYAAFNPDGTKKEETMLFPGVKVNRVGDVLRKRDGTMIVHMTKKKDPVEPVVEEVPERIRKRKKRKPKPKHFVCPMEHCFYRCNLSHDEKHCNGFSRLQHRCSHHCGPTYQCKRCHDRTTDLCECNRCHERFCNDCCFR